MTCPARHVSPARRLPDDLVTAAHDYQHRNRCRLVEVGEHFGVSADHLRDEFRRRGLKCVHARHRSVAKPERQEERACTDELVRAAHAWYLRTKDASMADAAAKYGLGYTRFRERMISLRLPCKQYIVNPLDAQFVRPFREMAAEIERRRVLRLRYNP